MLIALTFVLFLILNCWKKVRESKLPTFTAKSVSDVAANAAESRGNISDAGDSDVT
jgi:hypothetical protein